MPSPELVCPAAESDTGAYALSWTGPPGATYRVVEHGDGDELVLYEGLDEATTVTGRPPGTYEYRVGIVEGGEVVGWSEPCEVEVAPPSLGLAVALFLVGGLVTAATVIAVLRGHRAHRKGRLG